MSFFRRGGLDKAVYAALDAAAGGRAKVLAWGRTEAGVVVGLVDRLAIGDGDEWQFVPWHEIETGGWNAETSRLHWQLVTGSEGAVTLVEPGGLPGLFRERIEATIVLRLPYEPAGSSRAVTITGRRALGADQDIIWGWSAADRARLSPAVVRDIEAELARVRAEYEAA